MVNETNSDTKLISKLKDDGNEHFKHARYDDALQSYTNALKLCRHTTSTDEDTSMKDLRATLYKNRAAVHLKKEDFSQAERDATRALDIVPNDSKALFRRSQARERLESYSDAFNDAKLALHFEPNNKAIVQLLTRLAEMVQKKQKESTTTENRVNQMFQLCFDSNAENEKRVQATNNLLVLARENAGAALILERGGAEKLMGVILQEKNVDEELILAAQRVVDELAKDENRALKLIEKFTVERIVGLLNRCDVERACNSAALLIQRCFNALANMDPKNQKKPDEELVEKNKIVLIRLIFELKRALVDPSIGAVARNNAIDLLLKNLMHMDNGLPRGWSWEFLTNDDFLSRTVLNARGPFQAKVVSLEAPNWSIIPYVKEKLQTVNRTTGKIPNFLGLERLLRIACDIPEQCTLPVTRETREHLAICLARLYEDTVFDKYRSAYKDVVTQFVSTKTENLTPETKVQLCALMTTLLLGPFEIGFSIITSKGMTEMLLQMADSDNELHQSVALEAIIQTASKRERATFLANQGLPVLKKLYHSKDAGVQARALVGLCKVASSSGTDASIKPVSEGSELKLAAACKKLLLNAALTTDVRRWAAEGLSYLTLDADVKEWLVEDISVVRALVELAKKAGPLCVFGVTSIFVNLTNMYEKPQVDPELVRVAKFAKHHVPEDHPKDSVQFVERRVDTLVKEGATAACVAIRNTESDQCKELLARALFAFTKEKTHRGVVVQEGGAKLLLELALSGTEAGRTYAAQALAKIGVTMNPEMAFPGQRMYEVVKPLVALLHVEKTGLQNYEALLTLTNLASISDSVRLRIFKEKAMPMIEEYWFMQEHKDLRAAATELYLNLLHTKEVRDYVMMPTTDRLKLWMLYAGEDDVRLAKSAAAGLAVLTEDAEACKRLPNEVKSWLDILKELCMHENAVIQHRGLIVLANMMEADYDVAAKIVQTDITEVLVALTKMNDTKREKAIEQAKRALAAAEKWELIKPTDRELHERVANLSIVREES